MLKLFTWHLAETVQQQIWLILKSPSLARNSSLVICTTAVWCCMALWTIHFRDCSQYRMPLLAWSHDGSQATCLLLYWLEAQYLSVQDITPLGTTWSLRRVTVVCFQPQTVIIWHIHVWCTVVSSLVMGVEHVAIIVNRRLLKAHLFRWNHSTWWLCEYFLTYLDQFDLGCSAVALTNDLCMYC